MPQSWREKVNIYLKYSKHLEKLMKQYPIDLITHTIPMYEKFRKLNSMFSRTILNKGKILYEKNSY